MEHPTLWRIDNGAPAGAIDHARLMTGLGTHIAHSPLTTMTQRIGAQQRWYVGLEGCGGCVYDQCRIGCPAALFRRLFRACVPGQALQPLAPPQGLARRPYTRGVFAWPDARSTPLDSLLDPWEDARLLVNWRCYGGWMCVSALLLTGPDGPDSAQAFRAQRWRTLALPAWMIARWNAAAKEPTLPFGAPWRRAPFLLLPSAGSQAEEVALEPPDTLAPAAHQP